PLLQVAVPVARHHSPPRGPRVGAAQGHGLQGQRLLLLHDDDLLPPCARSCRPSARLASSASPVTTRPASRRAGRAARAAAPPTNSCPWPAVAVCASTTRVWCAKAATRCPPGICSP